MSETNSQISDAISDQVSVQSSSNQSEQMVHKSWRHDVQQLNGELLYFRPSKRHWFGKAWRTRYVLLQGGAVYLYKSKKDAKPKGTILLQETKLVSDVNKDSLPSKRADCVFALVNPTPGAQMMVVLSCKDQNELKLWVDAIRTNIKLQKPVEPPPAKSPESESITSKMLDALTSFSLCRKIIKDHMHEDTFAAIEALKGFVSKYDREFDIDELEKFFYTLGAKTLLLYREKKLPEEGLEQLKVAIHDLTDCLIDAVEIPFAFNSEVAVQRLQAVEILLTKLLKPVVVEKTLERIHAVSSYFQSTELLESFFTPKKYPETKAFGKALRHLWDTDLV